MTQKNSDFQTRLKEALAASPLSATALADKVGLSKQAISAYTSGVREPKRPTLRALAEALGVGDDWLAGYDAPRARPVPDPFAHIAGLEPMPELHSVPLLGTIACGTPILAQENIEDQVSVPGYIHADFALRCKGDSMIGAHIRDGDIVYIQAQPDVENGEIAAVLIGEEATLKRVYKSNGQLTLIAENSLYPPMVYAAGQAEEVRILGRAVAFTARVR